MAFLLRDVDVAGDANIIFKPLQKQGLFLGGFILDFLNNFKDFFTVFFESALSFSDFILYFSAVFAVGLIVKIFNKVRFGKC